MDWDILELDNNEYEWSHILLLDRLHEKRIDCYFADIWSSDEIAILSGCKATSQDIAKALNMHIECIYNDFEHDFVILNLFQEKYLRNLSISKEDIKSGKKQLSGVGFEITDVIKCDVYCDILKDKLTDSNKVEIKKELIKVSEKIMEYLDLLD